MDIEKYINMTMREASWGMTFWKYLWWDRWRSRTLKLSKTSIGKCFPTNEVRTLGDANKLILFSNMNELNFSMEGVVTRNIYITTLRKLVAQMCRSPITYFEIIIHVLCSINLKLSIYAFCKKNTMHTLPYIVRTSYLLR
jgi:hypothetical protein